MIRTTTQLRQHLSLLQDAGKLDDSNLRRAFRKAKKGGLKLSNDDYKSLFTDFSSGIKGDAQTKAKTFLDAAVSTMTLKEPGSIARFFGAGIKEHKQAVQTRGISLTTMATDVAKGDDRKLQRNEIDPACRPSQPILKIMASLAKRPRFVLATCSCLSWVFGQEARPSIISIAKATSQSWQRALVIPSSATPAT